MTQTRLYVMALALMLLIYAVMGAIAWQSASNTAGALKQRAGEIEQAQTFLRMH